MFRGYQAINARADDFHQTTQDTTTTNERKRNEQKKHKTLSYLFFSFTNIYIYLGECHKSLHGLPVSKTRNAIDGEWNKEFQQFFFLSRWLLVIENMKSVICAVVLRYFGH